MDKHPEMLWDRCLTKIKHNVSEQQFNNLFANITFLEMTEKPVGDGSVVERNVTVNVPSDFIYEYLEEHYVKLLQAVLWSEFGKGTKLLYNVSVDKTNEQSVNIPSSAPKIEEPHRTEAANKVPNPINSLRPQPIDSHLIPDKNFDNFIEGMCNKLPRAIGESIAEQPNKSTFNPLFIYGESGVGKTHLVNAIGTRIKELYPEKRVLYMSAHLFQVQFTDAVRNNRINDFIYFYQSIDVLIVDDIQEIAGLSKTQDCFFHIFNHLLQNGRKLILTSDRPPVDLQGMKERLLTRFKGGLLAELERPNIELRRKILKDKITHEGLCISDSVINFIADNVNQNVRELEGVINSLMSYSVIINKEIDVNMAEQVLKRIVKIEHTPITVESILSYVCNHYNVKQEDVFTSSRKRAVVQVRQVSMFLAQKYTSLSSSRIGTLIGKRDHATVLHSCSTVENRIKVDKVFKAEVEMIEDNLHHQKVG